MRGHDACPDRPCILHLHNRHPDRSVHLGLLRWIARALLEAECNRNLADYFLEVRASNEAARALYSVMGFTEVGVRPAYYENPPESGIVMKRSSCYRHIVRRPLAVVKV